MTDRPIDSDSSPPRGAFAWWSAATILLSAFLLFQVQPLISKVLLPWFGGSPAVWTTCMLFFQVLLLAGYAYAHLLTRLPKAAQQLAVHGLLLAVAAITLPITPDAAWKPPDSLNPTGRILLVLAANVGLPYFLLASTGPLVQHWFSVACVGRSPYRLYALSNAGSLAALVSYPFVFEPLLSTNAQGGMWSVCFGAFAVLCGLLAVYMWRLDAGDRSAARATAASAKDGKTAHQVHRTLPKEPLETAPHWSDYVAWLLFPALGSTALLAVTNHVCQDVAVIPFLWVVPLSLYLLSFIICFERDAWYARWLFAPAAILSVVVICAGTLGERMEQLLRSSGVLNARTEFVLEWLGVSPNPGDYIGDVYVEGGVYLAFLFIACMLFHGELVRRKPAARHLTLFYLMVSAGGALGGVFVALVCPRIFTTHYEMNLTVVATYLVAAGVMAALIVWLWDRKNVVARSGAILVGVLTAAGMCIPVWAELGSTEKPPTMRVRNFYGVLTVKDYGSPDQPQSYVRELLNGRIKHGVQYLDASKRKNATTYYNNDSGVGVAILNFPANRPMRVGVVGLGAGTIAAHGNKGDSYRFYEINEDVIDIAQTWFSFVGDARDRGVDVELVLGDARLSMERETPQNFDVLALDAFSGDAIPAHLLTVEAFEVYLKHMKPDGIIAVHISNRYLDLAPVVAALAEHFDFAQVEIHSADGQGAGDASSDWILLTRNKAFLATKAVKEALENAAADEDSEVTPFLWTDQYSNLFRILK